MSKLLTKNEKRAVVAELGYCFESHNYTALLELIDLLPPETLRDYIKGVRDVYGVDDDE